MNLKKTLFILPNMLTAASLFCGIAAIFKCTSPEATSEDIYRSALLLFYAFIFDLFDGRVARMTRTQSNFGIEFDSLADLISFGVAPTVISFKWAFSDMGFVGYFICYIYVLSGAIRLARFNVIARRKKGTMDTPSKYMLGLPIPMAAAFVVALVVAANAMGGWPWLTSHGFTVRGIGYPMMSIVMLALAFLMVSSIKFRSFKDFKLNVFSIIFLALIIISSLVLWITLKPAYILIWLLCLYVAAGFFEAIVQWPAKRTRKNH